ncbi:ferredoxin-type protein NapF [Pseudomonadota bacterium]
MVSRAQFLRGDLRGKEVPVRPPWAISEAAFTDSCSRCGDCIKVCTEKIIIKGRSGFPEVNFNLGECTFCGECVETCPEPLLFNDWQTTPPWDLKANINERCLAMQRVVCASCRDGCEVRAIRMRPQVGAVPIPEIDSTVCTGCGACFKACPDSAIDMIHAADKPIEHINKNKEMY